MSELRARSPIRPCALGGILDMIGIALLWQGTSYVWLAVILFMLSTWLILGGTLDSTVRLNDQGIYFLTFRGAQHWPWSEITKAYLSNTGTVPGIAVYRGDVHLRIGKAQFPDLDSVSRYIQAHVSDGVIYG